MYFAIKDYLEEEITLLNDRKGYLENTTLIKKKYRADIDKIDKIVNNKELLKEEYIRRNSVLENKDKIFSIKRLKIILEEERANLLEKIKEASQKGIIIYNVTQCQGGTVEMGRYETSRELLNYGVSSGYDITMEAAVCKMMYLLEKYRDANEIKKYLNSSIKGEITMNHIGF